MINISKKESWEDLGFTKTQSRRIHQAFLEYEKAVEKAKFNNKLKEERCAKHSGA